MLAECAHRRALIYWRLLPLLSAAAPAEVMEGADVRLHAPPQNSALGAQVYKCCLAAGRPAQEAEVTGKHEEGAAACTHVLRSWAPLLRARWRFMKRP